MAHPVYSATGKLSPAQREMLDDAIRGLSSAEKSLPCKYFYDDEGSRLFDEITELEEYYPTRTETGIMQKFISQMAPTLGEGVLLVEYGSGSSSKTRLLLDNLPKMAGYVPVDISGDYLCRVATKLQRDYPHISVHPVIADFTGHFSLPVVAPDPRRRIIYFPGSTIGNFARSDARSVLQQMAQLAGPAGGVLIGVDLVKPLSRLLAAYNDSRGVTAKFNINLLSRLNQELGADFKLDQFRHEAIFNAVDSRIEMYLVSCNDQSVCIDGTRFMFAKDEALLTEYSHKYTLESFRALAAEAGLNTQHVWTDDESLFSVQYLTPQ